MLGQGTQIWGNEELPKAPVYLTLTAVRPCQSVEVEKLIRMGIPTFTFSNLYPDYQGDAISTLRTRFFISPSTFDPASLSYHGQLGVEYSQ